MDEHRDGLRVFLNAVLYALLLVTPSANTLLGRGQGANANATQKLGSPLATVLQPPAWCFSIWPLLDASAAAYVLWQALPRNWENTLARSTGFWAAGAWAAIAAWGWLASTAAQPQPAALQAGLALLLLLALACLAVALGRVTTANRAPFSLPALLCCALPLSLLTAWIFVAAVLAAAAAALAGGADALAYSGPGGWAATAAAAALGAACVCLAVASDGNPYFSAVLVWALCGVADANSRPGHRGGAAAAWAGAGGTAAAAFASLAIFPAVRDKWCSCGARGEEEEEAERAVGGAPSAEPLLLARSLSRRYGATGASGSFREEPAAAAAAPGVAPSRVRSSP